MYHSQHFINQFELLDGKICVLDGIECKIEHKSYNAISPYAHVSHSLFARPTEKGKETDKYWEIRRALRDDWSTDLGENSELLVDVLYQLDMLHLAFPDQYKEPLKPCVQE